MKCHEFPPNEERVWKGRALTVTRQSTPSSTRLIRSVTAFLSELPGAHSSATATWDRGTWHAKRLSRTIGMPGKDEGMTGNSQGQTGTNVIHGAHQRSVLPLLKYFGFQPIRHPTPAAARENSDIRGLEDETPESQILWHGIT